MKYGDVTDISLSIKQSFGGKCFIVSLCCAAALRVFVFSAAFPFFSNVDEQAHFDLVLKYSRGHVPRTLEFYSPESARFIALFDSPEYLSSPDLFPEKQFPSPSPLSPDGTVDGQVLSKIKLWKSWENHEASQPPLYYAMAGLWLRLGRVCGLQSGMLLYWIRFLNIFLAAALVWLSYSAARLAYSDRPALWYAAPLLAAFIPQDTFYSIQSDVLSPIVFGVAFICLLRWFHSGIPETRWGIWTGLALAATGLTKTSNFPLLAVAGAALAWDASRRWMAGSFRPAWTSFIWLTFAALLPLAIWMVWNLLVFGDLTGSEVKVQHMGWKPKPLNQWFHHPIFTLRYGWIFLLELMATFWRGEFTWFGQRLSVPGVDLFYCLSSVVLVGVAAVGICGRTARTTLGNRAATVLSLACFIAEIAFLVLMSIIFDFGDCFYPSRAFPFFVSGRLMSGALIPFLLLYVNGLDQLLGRQRRPWLLMSVTVAIVLTMTISELAVNRVAFFSAYNAFHL